jgi:hypothetical protein
MGAVNPFRHKPQPRFHVEHEVFLHEDQALTKTCKMIRAIVKDGAGHFVGGNRGEIGLRAVPRSDAVPTWDKCEGSACAHWRWKRVWPWSSASDGNRGYCGLAGKP